ncbi:SDR family NAD(P)-dependent oxidoreductase [Bacteroidota bacterium]
MKDIINVYGSWCLVAGAAEGLGEAYSSALAVRGFNVIMVDQKEDSMTALADRLESQFGIETKRLHLDLAQASSVSVMMDAVRNTSCRLMIYNAAYSVVQKFIQNSTEDMEAYTDVNVRTPLQLVSAFTKFHMEDNTQQKGIILMSSLASFWGAGYLAPYGATKAFNRILAQGLHHELKHDHFDILACVAGATSTPAYLKTKPQYGRIRPHVMEPQQVAKEALRALGRKDILVTGSSNRRTVFLLSRLLPGRMSVSLFNKTVRQMFPMQ